MLDLAISFGCHPHDLADQFSPLELETLIVHQMTKNGYTFIQSDIKKHFQQERQQRHQALLTKAKTHWSNNNR